MLKPPLKSTLWKTRHYYNDNKRLSSIPLQFKEQKYPCYHMGSTFFSNILEADAQLMVWVVGALKTES